MSENVSEWIGEWDQFYRSDPDFLEYFQFDESAIRIIRGGNFRNRKFLLRNYWRVGVISDYESQVIGFRCATDRKN